MRYSRRSEAISPKLDIPGTCRGFSALRPLQNDAARCRRGGGGRGVASCGRGDRCSKPSAHNGHRLIPQPSCAANHIKQEHPTDQRAPRRVKRGRAMLSACRTVDVSAVRTEHHAMNATPATNRNRRGVGCATVAPLQDCLPDRTSFKGEMPILGAAIFRLNHAMFKMDNNANMLGNGIGQNGKTASCQRYDSDSRCRIHLQIDTKPQFAQGSVIGRGTGNDEQQQSRDTERH